MTSFLHKLVSKIAIFRGFPNFFQNYWIPTQVIIVSLILYYISLEISKKSQVDAVLGGNLTQIRCNVLKSTKKLAPVSSLQHCAKNMLQMFVIQHTSIWPNFILIVLTGFKTNEHKCNFHYVEMPMMTSQILKSMGFAKTQKSRYLGNKTLFFFQIKKIILLHIKGYFILTNSFVAEVTFKSNIARITSFEAN